MGIFNFDRLRRDENKIVNKAQRGLDKEKNKEKDYIPNRTTSGRVTTGEFEDEYTRQTRAEKFWGNSDRTKDHLFIDAQGNETPIDQLNEHEEVLLTEARESIAQEIAKTERLTELGELGEETEEAMKGRAKSLDIWYDPPRQKVDNLKTNSPAKRRLDIRKTRTNLEKIETLNNKKQQLEDEWRNLSKN